VKGVVSLSAKGIHIKVKVWPVSGAVLFLSLYASAAANQQRAVGARWSHKARARAQETLKMKPSGGKFAFLSSF